MFWLTQTEALLAAESFSVVAFVAALLVAPGRSKLDAVAAVMVPAGVFAIGAFVITHSRPAIDVWHILNEASDLIFRKNVYVVQWSGVDQHNYPYLPMTSVLLAPFRWFAGDVRWGLLLAVVGTAAVLGVAWSRRRDPSPPWFLLAPLTPGTLVIIEAAWNEPLLLVLVAGSLVAFDRKRRWVGVVLFALALASKQHVAVLLPLLFVWRPAGQRATMLAAALAGALCLPWFLMDPHAFIEGILLGHAGEIGRLDSATVHTLGLLSGVSIPPVLLAVVPLGAMIWAVRRVRSARHVDAAELAGLGGLVLLAANLFSTHAFINQYYFALGLLLFALVYVPIARTSTPAPVDISGDQVPDGSSKT